MEITKIRIRNFKSIKNEISLKVKKIAGKSCHILLGVNESGKSNILEAISLLDSKQKVNYETCCNQQAQKKEERIAIYYLQKYIEQDDDKKRLDLISPEISANNIKLKTLD